MTEHPKRLEGLEITPVEDGFMIYQPEKDRVHYLNHTAVLVLELANGRHTSAEIAALVQQAYSLPAPPKEEVSEILAKMQDEGLME